MAKRKDQSALSLELKLFVVGTICIVVMATFLDWVSTAYAVAIGQAQEQADTMPVAVARRDLKPGVPITEHDLYILEVERWMVPETIVEDPLHAIGRIPRERILANEVVRTERLANPEIGEGLNAIIPRHMRAHSITVDDGQALSGMLDPGSYVDVLVTYHQGTDRPVAETQTVLQAVFVLAVNDQLPDGKTLGREAQQLYAPSVTLLVTPQQAVRLAHAENTGRLHLSLRNDADEQLAQLHGIDVSSLRTRLAAPARRARAAEAEQVAEYRQVRIIRGDAVEEIQIVSEATHW